MKTLTLVLAFSLPQLLIGQGDDALLAGMSAMKKADHEAAANAFDKAVAADPSNGKTWYYRAMNKMVLGDHEGALSDLDHLLILEPRDVHAMLRRAEVQRLRGEEQKANSDLHRVLGLHHNGPAAEHALLELGRLAMEKDDLPSALAYYDRLVGIAPYNPMAWCNRGVVRKALMADDEALADLEKAIELDPTADQTYVNIALIHLRQGRKQEGCYALQQAHDLGDRTVEELMLVHCDR